MASVCIYQTDYPHVADAVERAFETLAPPVEGRTVLVKPNVLGAMGPETHVNTNPAVVRAVVEALERRRAGRIIVGDNSGMRAYGSNEHAARVAGILDVAGRYFVNLGASPRPVAVESAWAKELAFSREVLEADLVIGVPKMKTHVGTVITGAVKNTFGHLVGGQKTRLHRVAIGPDNFARALIDVYRVRPPDLVIMDAVMAMEGQGPSGGRARPVNRLLASTSAVAIDAVMAAMMGLEPRKVPMLRIAAELGLGPIDLRAIQIDGPMEVVANFRVPAILQLANSVTRLMAAVFVTQPTVRLSRCVRCGSCVKACPVEAITMTDSGPVIDRARCISCFCCHEMCRYGAMDLTRRMKFFQHNARY